MPIVVTVLFGAAYYYLALPALNLQSREFWAFLGILLVVWLLCALLTSGVMRMDRGDVRVQGKLKGLRFRIPLIALGVIVLFNIIGGIVSAPIFHAQSYYELLDVQTGDFASDVAEISYSEIPMLDRDSSVQLGKRALGSIGATSNLVSQFEVADYEYSQINYQGEPVRVAPLEYGNLIKWFNNRADGLPGYIVVNMVTQEARLVRLEEGMKISNSEHFGRNLYRVLRFRYPTMMFGDVNFEIDEDGTPWWICSRIVKTIGIFGGTDIHGAVLVNAVTGESAYYEDVPTWVDRVYNADLVVEQYNYHGTLVNGWVNSWLGQKGITTTTEGYNYIAQNDDVYLYTGVTSAGEDESNVGFILVNQRTKEARYYNITGAEEYSAMSSAQGAVQHLHYTATFPILLNISNEPTYFMALKDSAELVKMYAMVNVADYQITATGASVEACQRNYEALLAENGIQVTDPVIPADQDTVSGTLADLRSVVVEGTTLFYLTMEDGRSYVLSAASCPEAVLLNPGDRVTITFELGEGDILTAVSVAKE
ncbi:MAG: CvpA family protein [Oscillospiraceae bacterium]|nr:CvpA family protein [Oscillospiraceae bacterium]